MIPESVVKSTTEL